MKENIVECFEQLIHDYNKHSGECLKIETESILDGLGVSLSINFTNVGHLYFNDCIDLIGLANNDGEPSYTGYGSDIDFYFEFTYTHEYEDLNFEGDYSVWGLNRFNRENDDCECIYWDYLNGTYWKFEMYTYWECDSTVAGTTTIKRENDKLFLTIDYGRHDGIDDNTSWVYPIKTDYNQSILGAVV